MDARDGDGAVRPRTRRGDGGEAAQDQRETFGVLLEADGMVSARTVMVRIENICPDFFAFWERAEGRARGEQVDLWRTLYEDRHRDILDVYYGGYGSPDRLGDALGRFPRAVPITRGDGRRGGVHRANGAARSAPLRGP